MFVHPIARALLAIAMLAAFAAPASAASKLIANLNAGQSQTVVVYGTSLTAGGAWTTQTKSWLDTTYPGKVTFVNSGQSGKASQTGLNLLSSAVLSKNPSTVFIEFAMNDAFTAYATTDVDYNITPAESKANLNAMIDAIMAGHPEREVILQTMNPAWDAPNGNLSGSKRANLSVYYQGYRDVAAERNLLLIDNYVNWIELQNNNLTLFKTYVADGVHPSTAGYQAIVTPVIQAALVPEPTGIAVALIGIHLLCTRRPRRSSSHP